MEASGAGWSDDASRIRVFGLAGTTVAIASPLAEKVRLIDVTKPESAPVERKLVDAALINDMRFTDDRSHIVQINSDGRFYIFKVADGTQVLSGSRGSQRISAKRSPIKGSAKTCRFTLVSSLTEAAWQSRLCGRSKSAAAHPNVLNEGTSGLGLIGSTLTATTFGLVRSQRAPVTAISPAAPIRG